MRTYVIGLTLAMLLIGCGQAPRGSASASMAPIMAEERASDAPAPAGPAASAAQDAAGLPRPAPNLASAPASASAPVIYLAYSYQIGLELPAEQISALMDAHVRACLAAGPRLCQLIGANRSGDPASHVNGSLDMRGEPHWLGAFMGAINAQASAAGGRIATQATATEDLTRNIVDTQAHLRAESALRDRLQQMLQSHPGKLSDLLDVERELARVQGDLDATQSELAVMRTRVDMSELTLSYDSAPRSLGSDTFEPLRQALAGFLGVVVIGFAAIVTLIAGLTPFAVVLIPIIWLLLRWRSARGGRFFGPGSKPKPQAKSDG